MKLYVKILLTGLSIMTGANLIFCSLSPYSFPQAMICLLFAFGYCGILCGIVSILAQLLPKTRFRWDNKRFRVFAFETHLYEKLGIRRWKEKIPELGKLSGFPKDKVYLPKDPAYLQTFLQQNCIAEWLHTASVIGSLVIFILLPSAFIYSVALPVFLLNGLLHLLPVFIQRYLRPRLIRLYGYSLKRSQTDAAHRPLATETDEAASNGQQQPSARCEADPSAVFSQG